MYCPCHISIKYKTVTSQVKLQAKINRKINMRKIDYIKESINNFLYFTVHNFKILVSKF